MILSNLAQFNLLVQSIFAGIFTGLLFDVYRVLRGQGLQNKIVCFIEDILFWILVATCIFIFLLYTSDAIMGIYVYIFIGIGVYLYIKILSKNMIYHERKLLLCICKITRILINLIAFPIRLLINKLFKKEQ
jgi:spore cortex biosynthesis protein YabQ